MEETFFRSGIKPRDSWVGIGLIYQETCLEFWQAPANFHKKLLVNDLRKRHVSKIQNGQFKWTDELRKMTFNTFCIDANRSIIKISFQFFASYLFC